MATMQQVVDRARIPVNDSDKSRYSDADLLAYANDAISILKMKRPDLFYGSFLALPGDKALTDTFPLDSTLLPAVSSYVTAMAETRNDESVIEQRAALFFGLFKGQLE